MNCVNTEGLQKDIKKEHHTSWLSAFDRQLESPENYEIPDEIFKAWNHAVATKSRSAKNAVFQAFLKSGKQWSRSLGKVVGLLATIVQLT